MGRDLWQWTLLTVLVAIALVLVAIMGTEVGTIVMWAFPSLGKVLQVLN